MTRKLSSGEWAIIGIVASVFVSGFFYWLSEKTKDLSFVVSPTRAEIVRGGIASDLKASYRGIEITGTLSAIQIGVWNNGRDAIRNPEDILRKVVLRSVGVMKIIEAKVISETRPEIGFSVSHSSGSDEVAMGWKILEKGDGALIQLLVLNAFDQPLEAAGTIVGQGAIGANTFKQPMSASALSRKGTWAQWLPIAISVLFVAGAIATTVLFALWVRRNGWRRAVKEVGFHSCFFLMISAAWLYELPKNFASSPFGF
jgi:hypothetical protein